MLRSARTARVSSPSFRPDDSGREDALSSGRHDDIAGGTEAVRRRAPRVAGGPRLLSDRDRGGYGSGARGRAQDRPRALRGGQDLPRRRPRRRGLRSRLDRIAPPVELFTEHLDLSWASGQDYEAQLALFLREKYAGRRIDLVVPVLAHALRFALTHREELFPRAPIVFCLVDPVGAAGLHLGPDVTGVWMVPEARATLDLAVRLQPDTQRAVVVGGASALDRTYLEDVRQELARNPHRSSSRISPACPWTTSGRRWRAFHRGRSSST